MRRFRWSNAVLLGALALLWFILIRHLSNEWSVNEQYSYGWFVPFFAAFLFWLRWEDRPAPGAPPRHGAWAALLVAGAALLLLLFPLRLFAVGNPDWRPLAWVHGLIVVGLTLLVIWRAGGRPWLRHFAFPVCFILVAVPWISPIEAPLVQGLMGVVALVATEALNVLGMPAQLEGSLIRVSTGLVGVNEACSGVRSLQTSLMIGLLFGELKRLSVGRRFALLGGALAIALLANFGRAFTLVWISATRSPEAANSWHDTLGYAIVGLVFIGSMALAAALSKGRNADAAPTGEQRTGVSPFTIHLSPFTAAAALAWLLAIEIGVETWYRSHERDLIARESWTVSWPEEAPGFRQVDISEDVQRTLRYDSGRQVAWSLTEGAQPRSAAATAFMFFFRWEPGTSTILRARAHRPDVCLPNVGWRQLADHGVRNYSLGGELALPFRHFAFVREMPGQRTAYAHSFFCIREDKVRPEDAANAAADLTRGEVGGWMRDDRTRVVLEGLRNPGQQVMQVVFITPDDPGEAGAEAKFRDLLPRIVTTGKQPKL